MKIDQVADVGVIVHVEPGKRNTQAGWVMPADFAFHGEAHVGRRALQADFHGAIGVDGDEFIGLEEKTF